MKGIDDVFFVPENETQIKIGDYYYIDGSLSHEYQDTKECIGVVFCIGYNLGYTKGSVVALRDAITEEGQLLHLWRNVNDGNEKNGINEKNNGIRFKMAALKTDFGGLFYSKHLFDDEYVAINLARQYPIELSSEKTSGWYLPSSGQMWHIAYRFIDTDNYAEQKAILHSCVPAGLCLDCRAV